MIVLGAINLALLLVCLKFIVPKEFYQDKSILQDIRKHLPHLLIIFGVVALHLFEVNVVDPSVTEWVGHDFTNEIKGIEGDIVYQFSQNWIPALVYFFVIMYTAVYPFTLWFSPFYFLQTDNKKAMKTFAYGLLLIYVIALPFYLFMPITNVYTYYNINSALETVIPSVESFFYSTTTQNNCLPSLHTAMTILVAYSVSLTGNKKLTYFAYFTMISVIISVIYLSIHWITDVIAGALLAVGAIFILRRFMQGE
ncbi:MAG: inositol phosphorylceramide synthase [Thermoplasmatales archaeon]|nr:inositol phosphorylceramide synthase [Thermoplasmatales archaeon]